MIVHILQRCQCKNTCSRKSGRKKRGCPCRDETLFCTDQCSCGTTKGGCKNKPAAVAQGAVHRSVGLNAFERHRIAVEESKQEITVRIIYFADFLSEQVFSVYSSSIMNAQSQSNHA